MSLGWSTFESFLQHDAQALHRCRCEGVEKLMRVKFSQFPNDSDGNILKYDTLVEKVAARLASKLCQLSSLIDFIFSDAICSGVLDFYGSPADGKVIWFREILRELIVNWSSKSIVKLEISNLVSLRKVIFARSLVTTSRVGDVRLHLLLSNINSSASLRDGDAKVRKLVSDLQFTFDPGGIGNGLGSRIKFMKKFYYLSGSRAYLFSKLIRELGSCQRKMDLPGEIAIKEWRKAFLWDTYDRSSLLQEITSNNQLLRAQLGEHFLKFPYDPGGSSFAIAILED